MKNNFGLIFHDLYLIITYFCSAYIRGNPGSETEQTRIVRDTGEPFQNCLPFLPFKYELYRVSF